MARALGALRLHAPSPAILIRRATRLLSLAAAQTPAMSAAGNKYGIAEVAGDASTTEELLACKIGGCCGKDTPLLPVDAIVARMSALPDWTLSADKKIITKEFVAKNWGAAMGFFNAVSEIAEAEGHHPDLHLTNWRDVRIALSTHAIGGLSMPDLVLAAKIDAIAVEVSPKWLREREAKVAVTGKSAQPQGTVLS